MFSTSLNVCMWKALANQQWPCRHTHISTLFKIYRFFENRSKSLSKQSTLLRSTYRRHLLGSKPNYQQRKYWSQGNKATTGSGKLHTICFSMHCIGNTYIYMYVYIYNGYKNLSTYLSYTAGFLQAQELSDLLKPLKMVQLHLPGFQNFALPKNVYMWKALANQQWSCRHTHKHIYIV